MKEIAVILLSSTFLALSAGCANMKVQGSSSDGTDGEWHSDNGRRRVIWKQ